MANELLFFMEVLVGGLLAGTMYSLVALGFVLIFKALKIRTNPKATKEYIVPASKPPTRTSIKNNSSFAIL